MRGFRTDLAMESVGEESGRLEGVSMSAHQIGGVKRTRIVIQSRRRRKPCSVPWANISRWNARNWPAASSRSGKCSSA